MLLYAGHILDETGLPQGSFLPDTLANLEPQHLFQVMISRGKEGLI